MKIAVEGCAHGDLEKIYEVIGTLEAENNIKVDLLICCGDFQSVRCEEDLLCMAVPVKYRHMNTFYKYYSGEKVAPYLTIFVGGNHEASNYLGELAYGGWVCPQIYYLGYASVINVNGIRIAGLSGIYKGLDYLKGHYETSPFSEDTKRSSYHIRSVDVFRLKQISHNLDIMLSHDWPRGIYHHGDTDSLMNRKPYFKAEIDNNTLGSRPAQDLLEKLQPKFWFSAHLHVKFAAVVQHNNKDLKDDEDVKVTKFLALDKCLPRRQFLQILDIGPDLSENEVPELSYDLEWLTILRTTDHLLNITSSVHYMPGPGCSERIVLHFHHASKRNTVHIDVKGVGYGDGTLKSPEDACRWDFIPTEGELKETLELMDNNLKVPLNFTVSVPAYDPNKSGGKIIAPSSVPNSQTIEFCRKLGITDPLSKILSSKADTAYPSLSTDVFTSVPDESEASVTLTDDPNNVTSNVSCNPEEIDLADGSDIDDSQPEDLLIGSKPEESDLGPLNLSGEKTSEESKEVVNAQNENSANRKMSDGPPIKLKRRNANIYREKSDEETD